MCRGVSTGGSLLPPTSFVCLVAVKPGRIGRPKTQEPGPAREHLPRIPQKLGAPGSTKSTYAVSPAQGPMPIPRLRTTLGGCFWPSGRHFSCYQLKRATLRPPALSRVFSFGILPRVRQQGHQFDPLLKDKHVPRKTSTVVPVGGGGLGSVKNPPLQVSSSRRIPSKKPSPPRQCFTHDYFTAGS